MTTNHTFSNPGDDAARQALRQRIQHQRAAFPADERVRASLAIQQAALGTWDPRWQMTLVYVSLPHEVSTVSIIMESLRQGRRICVPAFDSARHAYFASEIRSFEEDLETGHFGILEPRRAALRPVAFADLDAIFLPGLAFDRAGNRLGFGYGHFDAIGRQSRAFKTALAFNFQLVDHVPIHAGDVPVDRVITEMECLTCRKP